MKNTCVSLTISSPHRLTTTVYLPHTLMRRFFNGADYMNLLTALKPFASYNIGFSVADSYKAYKSDSTISSLLLLESLMVSCKCDIDTAERIKEYVRSDRTLRRYAVNYDLNTVQDIEFTISCKVDYISFVRRRMAQKALNIISQHNFRQYVVKADKMAVN